MRRLGRLIAFLFLVLILSTGVVYYYQRQKAEANATPPPAPLPEGVAGTADRWQWTHTVDGKPMVEISAREYRMIQKPARVELSDVELKIFGGDTTAYDLVKSKRADVDTRAKTMYSEGEVEIVMRIPNDGRPMPARPMTIRSSKVHFETESGKAKTAEKTFFQFAEGFGECVGAQYDPQAKEVTLESEAQITLAKEQSTAGPTKVWAAHAIYREVYSKIELTGPTRMERQKLAMDAGDATIELKDGEIQRVEAHTVSGVDRYPARELAFGADLAEMKYRPDGTLAEIYGSGQSRLDAVTPASRSEVRSAKMNLYFREGTAEPELEKSFAHGGATLRSIPLGKSAATQPRRVLESDVIEVQMRPGGAEAERLLTHAPGTLTFLPATDEQRERKLVAERMNASYGANNALERFEATKARTESKPAVGAVARARQQKAEAPGLLVTKSETLEARFNGVTGEMEWMKQEGNFEFTEGVRRGKANRATLHQTEKYNLLDGKAQIWDASGTLQADSIRTVEPSGDLVAEGHVVSTRKPEPKQGKAAKGPELSLPGGEETLQATASRMTTRNGNQWIRYEGNARLWQGANRLHADAAIIDRDAKVLEGIGKVFSQIEEKKASAPGATAGAGAKATGGPGAKVYTLIHAGKMRYTDSDKVARYEGNVRMRRASLSVDSEILRMHLRETASGDTELEKAYADEGARILIEEPGNRRRGGGEHAEYYPPDEKMVLYGGEPFFEDQKEGATRGKRLTYFSREDRLIVESGDTAPAVSVIRRK